MTTTSTSRDFEIPAVRCELIASLAVQPRFSGAMDLLLGVHPEEHRDLTEIEEAAGNCVSLLARDGSVSGDQEMSRALALWRMHWPGWQPAADVRWTSEGILEHRWHYLLPHCTPLGLAYLFSPFMPRMPSSHAERDREYRAAFRTVDRIGRANPLSRSHPTWTTSLFPNGNLRDIFEQLCGLTGKVKSQLGVDEKNPGWLLRYAASHEGALDELIDPRQFEHLIADIYRAEGWDCHVTPYSKDEGIDIRACRVVDGLPVITLIQAKRNRSRKKADRSARPVGVKDVQVFAATVRGEKETSGVLVTTSSFTRGARRWAAGKGRNVAVVQLVDGAHLRNRLYDVCNHHLGSRAIEAFFIDIGVSP